MARILVLTQAYVPDPASSGQHLHGAAAALAARGHDVRVLAASRGYNDPGQRYPRREARDGVEIRRIPLSSFGKASTLVRAVGAFSLAVQTIARGLLSRRNDAILVSTSPPLHTIAALVLSWLRGTPICYWVMDLYPDAAIEMGMLREGTLPVRMMEWLNRRILGRAKRIVFLDRFMAARTRLDLDVTAKSAVMPPWPHNDPTECPRHADNPWRRQHADEGRLVVMYSGGFTAAHPLDTLLQAALRLKDDKRIEFFFVGDGSLKREIETLIEQERPPNIRSLPYQPLETLRYSLSAADVHVVSVGNRMVGISHPCKIYGAMAAGRPILLLGPDPCHATDIIGEHDIGWHVAHGDVDRAVDVLREIRSTPCARLLRMGETAQELIRRHYSRDVLRSRFCNEMETILLRTPPPR